MLVQRFWAGLRAGAFAGGLAAAVLAMTPAAPAWAGFSAFAPSPETAQGENGWFLAPGTITYTAPNGVVRQYDYTDVSALGVPIAQVYVTRVARPGNCSLDGSPVATSPTHHPDRSEWVIPVPPSLGPDDTGPGAVPAFSGTYDLECTYRIVQLEKTVYIGFIDGETEITEWVVGEQAQVKIDTTPPAVSPTPRIAAASDPKGTHWHRTATTVDFAGSDDGSGIAWCSEPVVIGGPADAGERTAVGSCRNGAGVVTEATYAFRFDDEQPESSPSLPSVRNGWYRDDTEVTWNWSDRLSGVVPDACPATSATSGEGEAVQVEATCADWAGNQGSASRTVKVDATAPVITLLDRPGPNAAGWHNHDVVIRWSCADGLSGPESETTSRTVETEGADVSVTGACSDLAGNAARDTQAGIRLDKTPPAAQPVVTGLQGRAGWHLSPVSVLWLWSDALSGVDVERCSLAGFLPSEGRGQRLGAHCADVADNAATASRTFDIDLADPEILATVDRGPGTGGWYTAPVAVRHECDDPGQGSGLAEDACPQDVVVDEEGETTVARTVSDRAGRGSAASTTVKVDLNDPTIEAAPGRGPDAGEWYTSPVAVAFTCSDPPPGSGVADCPDPVAVTAEGRHTVSGRARDLAGRASREASTDVQLDLEPPDATISGRGVGTHLGLGGLKIWDSLRGAATDAMSGVRQVAVSWTTSGRGTETVIADLECADATRRACTWSAKLPFGQSWNAVVVATDRVGRGDPTPPSPR